MTRHRADVCRADQTILTNITVYIEEKRGASGKRSWYGFIQLDRGQRIEEGGPYTIQLDDHRSGEISVGDVTVSSHSPTRVNFKGSGPLS